MLVGVGGGARGGRLVSSWEIGFVRVFLGGDISIAAVTAAGGFALTASPFCQTTQKEPKSLAPNVRPLAKARGSFAPAFIRGHRPPVGFAGTYMRCVRLRRTALRANPRMNASTQPAEGAGGSRSRAAGELTLGPVGASLLAMDVNDNAGCLNARVVLAFFASKLAPTRKRVQLRSGRQAGRRGRSRSKARVASYCRNGLAREGGATIATVPFLIFLP
ncbi:hypothetical protein DOZ80_01230 [Pseudomonas fluorescens]|uniref:Uncharacterized protein n=1 Tax=Pseudomonas fluorescens TaxID=294 RepID=A0A327NI23_PSEFL|nr:hypothetical protein DOZ80_01230 [Pseudomonas fluorescens]